ncbi:hypothetical protein CPB84DRAFT_1846197 [Gymnopilus junonius]|uniref:Lysine-specific metallo-endopeptidase domain-containing protein n=1 Tax=Gymnopilus junonius TaxID=109634 RepID=A0A9P5NMW6_GYMJU|nr:hypothetical protein CPB84DRAFT_1846197 [Gymnopilus junonius]
MRSFHYLAMLIALVNFTSVVQSAPLPLEIGTIYGHNDLNNPVPRPLTPADHQYEQNIRTAAEQAHQQVLNMQRLLNGPHEEAHPHLVNAFGENYNKPCIKETVDQLAQGTIHIGDMNQANKGEKADRIAETYESQARVSLMNKFHQMDPAARAGTIIHEATHALAGTRDLFNSPPGNSNDIKPLHPQAKASMEAARHTIKVGYHYDGNTGGLHQDFVDLKQNAGRVMHKNADSYKVLAHTATHGLRTNPPAPFPLVHQQPCKPNHQNPKCTIV